MENFNFDNFQSVVDSSSSSSSSTSSLDHAPVHLLRYDGSRQDSREGGLLTLRETANQQRIDRKRRKKQNSNHRIEKKWGVIQKIENRTLMITDIDQSISKDQVIQLFKSSGTIEQVILPDRNDSVLKVIFSSSREAINAKEKKHRFKGKEIQIFLESDHISNQLWKGEETYQREEKVKIEAPPPSPPNIVKSIRDSVEDEDDEEDFELPFFQTETQENEINLNEDEGENEPLKTKDPIITVSNTAIFEKPRDPRLGNMNQEPITAANIDLTLINQVVSLVEAVVRTQPIQQHQQFSEQKRQISRKEEYEYKDFVSKKCDSVFKVWRIEPQHYGKLKQKSVHQFLEKVEGKDRRRDENAIRVMQECARHVLSTYDSMKQRRDLEKWINE